jgi:hypothetical protein
MKPIFQAIVDKGRGDCFRCCLASILELERDEVPNFRELMNLTGVDMMAIARQWLKDKFDLSLVTIYMHGVPECGDDFRLTGGIEGTPLIVTVDSPNIPGAQHAVVGEIDDQGINVRIIHDPHPNPKPIETYPLFISMLVPLRPALIPKTNG